MAARLRDVAELAGVSVKTVSNVVNDHPHIRDTTRARVEAAIAELGYRPNLSARQLKNGRSGFLALVVPEIESPYFADLGAKFSAAASERGYFTLFETTHGSRNSEETILRGLPRLAVDGIVFSPLVVDAATIEERATQTPMALLGERAVPAGVPLVSVDSVPASHAMTEHLIGLGRRRIAAIGREVIAPDGQATSSVRLQGYRQALAEAGLPYDDALVVGVREYSRGDGYAAMRTLLDLPEPPDAVYCFNDLMAIGAIRACHDAGLRVPDDVAVAGFDNITEGRYSTPRLTTIAPDLDALVAAVLDELIGRITGGIPPNQGARVHVPWTLEARESTLGR
ncbi:LacI family DNA-binding transcriptional regulator [Aestuariimicrobium soli]|uniref:LacI family DNA-binding transcriptional regulator n=1 Tax=Aestuariimicrobium soli TaxID=2035834 RepID=UPI003EB7BAD2